MGSPKKRVRNNNTKLARGGTETEKVVLASPKAADDVTVHLLQRNECARVKALFLQEMYRATSTSIAVDLVQRWQILSVTVISACLLYLLTLSMYIANVPFLLLPLLGYYYVTKVQTTKLYSSTQDMLPGVDFYDYWCKDPQTERYVWVAKLGDKVVGAAAVSNVTDSSAVIDRLAVLQHYQLRGIGTRLLYSCIESCIRKSILNIELVTSYKQTGAHRLVEKFGFQRVQETLQGTFWPFFTFPAYLYRLTSDVVNCESLEDGDD